MQIATSLGCFIEKYRRIIPQIPLLKSRSLADTFELSNATIEEQNTFHNLFVRYFFEKFFLSKISQNIKPLKLNPKIYESLMALLNKKMEIGQKVTNLTLKDGIQFAKNENLILRVIKDSKGRISSGFGCEVQSDKLYVASLVSSKKGTPDSRKQVHLIARDIARIAKERGCSTIYCHVNTDAPGLIKLYESFGFKVTEPGYLCKMEVATEEFVQKLEQLT